MREGKGMSYPSRRSNSVTRLCQCEIMSNLSHAKCLCDPCSRALLTLQLSHPLSLPLSLSLCLSSPRLPLSSFIIVSLKRVLFYD